MNTKEIIAYLDDYLQIRTISDYGPQGLQVESDNPAVQRIALAVDTAPRVILAAADWQADMLLVHHGILWRQVERISGPLGHRVRLLMNNHIPMPPILLSMHIRL